MARPFCRNAGTIRKLDNSMDWLILVAAGCMETIWAVLLKYTHGFTRFWPTAATLAAMAVSFWLLALALKTLPMGTAYVVWTGIGAVGVVVVGIHKYSCFQRSVKHIRSICVDAGKWNGS